MIDPKPVNISAIAPTSRRMAFSFGHDEILGDPRDLVEVEAQGVARRLPATDSAHTGSSRDPPRCERAAPLFIASTIEAESSNRRKCTAEVFSSFSRFTSSSAIANTRSISLTRTQHRSSMPINFSSALRRSSGSGNSSSSVTFQLLPSGIRGL